MAKAKKSKAKKAAKKKKAKKAPKRAAAKASRASKKSSKSKKSKKAAPKRCATGPSCCTDILVSSSGIDAVASAATRRVDERTQMRPQQVRRL